MSLTKYEELVPLIMYFFENTGATSVEIGDPPIKVTRKEYSQSTSSQNQILQLINNITSNVNIDNRIIVQDLLRQLEYKGLDPKKLDEAKTNLDKLSKEVDSTNPKWASIKKVILWALEYGKDFFVQLVPLLLKMNK